MIKKSFTLIELLVVVAIIAVLVAILLPGLQTAREHTKALLCATRLKTIGSASQMYFTANNDRVPTDTGVNPLRVCLHPYLRAFDRNYWESSVNWSCPNAPHTRPIPITISYGMNIGVAWGHVPNPWDWGYGTQNPFRLSQVDHARFIWVTETGQRPGPRYWEWYFGEDDYWPEPTWNRWRSTGVAWNLWTVVLGPPWDIPGDGYPVVPFRHRTRANALYLDGHVEALNYGQMQNSRLWLRE